MVETLSVKTYGEIATLLKRERQRVREKGAGKTTTQDLADLVSLLLSAVIILAEAESERSDGRR
jgi:hypothetical protein